MQSTCSGLPSSGFGGRFVFTTRALAARAAVETVAARTTVEAVATLVAVALLQHDRLTFLELLDADGHEAQHVLVDAHLALHLGDGRRGSVDVQERVVRLAVLLDAIAQRLHTPVLDLGDGTAIRLDDALELLDKGLDLLRADILPREQNVLVQCHDWPFFVHRFRSTRSPPSPG
ncbi:conserved hypothetical protein [Bosea sp. 62]|nr:conserved hypothetical protein [Bosea sp. 46]CAD5262038.1 conserved hypothetical protein [Bosea sp. 21B]CAD5278471.1 conserved hypothetical protein [Bosea sp. 7B]VVT58623.1 conserved hypothetical protein [Bosea sp. EC-HK365B]VXB57512.1 conserved hypothetical protein [Bosea sp. 29B]VXB99060.1 conserved hypothetical protein [Bosea sp. 125]VXC42222.1 conserved hypothetical protein [Bosea sp. 62]VXC81183.1 conserved hypothetical protein [Bosea sp. 127]